MIYYLEGKDFSYSYPADSVFVDAYDCSRPNVHGRVRFYCVGPNLNVRVQSTYGISTDESKIAVYVDGLANQEIQPTTTTKWYQVTIPFGVHLVEIEAGQQSGPGYPVVTGTWPNALSAVGLQVLPPQKFSRWLAIEDDSIANGQPTNPGVEDWISIVRNAMTGTGWGLACLSYGFRSMFDQTDHASVALHLDLMCPGADTIIIANVLGTNDYGLSRQSAANYAIMYAARLAAYQARFTTRLKKAWVVTPFPRLSEGGNTFGDTLTGYANAGLAQVGGKVFAIDAHAQLALTAGDYIADGVHPNTSGHGKAGAYMLPRLFA